MRCLAALALALLAPRLQAECPSASACNTSGSRLLAAGQVEQAVEDFLGQAGWAEDADDAAAQALAFNNLALAELKRAQPLLARAWVRQALRVKPGDKAALFNQGQVDKALAARQAPAGFTGTWRGYAGAGEWNTLEVQDRGGGRLRFMVFALRMGANWREYGPAAVGNVDGEVTLQSGKGLFKGEDCALALAFSGDEATVEQDGGCGFGMGVDASGTYLRTDDAPPRLEQ